MYTTGYSASPAHQLTIHERSLLLFDSRYKIGDVYDGLRLHTLINLHAWANA
ncbi:MAG: hypothetical protein V7K92_21410 [Nostoc sp.]